MASSETEKPVFEIDAGKILAQFHLANTKISPKGFFFNSGIENMDNGATFDNPKKVKFNTEGPGLYELAYMPEIQYVDIGKTSDELRKEIEEIVNKKTEDENIGTDEDTIAAYQAHWIREAWKDFNKDVDKKIADFIEKKCLNVAFDIILKYMMNFAGEKTGRKIQQNDIQVCWLPLEYQKGPSYIKKYNNFKIKVANNGTRKKMARERYEKWNNAKNSRLFELTGLAFKIVYTLEVQTK